MPFYHLFSILFLWFLFPFLASCLPVVYFNTLSILSLYVYSIWVCKYMSLIFLYYYSEYFKKKIYIHTHTTQSTDINILLSVKYGNHTSICVLYFPHFQYYFLEYLAVLKFLKIFVCYKLHYIIHIYALSTFYISGPSF